jgi:uncharacterized membrane protein
MTEPTPDQFEMRRLESLSNTIFGVAMTLLAYDLPKPGQLASNLPGQRGASQGEAGPLASLPGWIDLYHLYGVRVLVLALSFVIAGIFWFSQQRRLARQPYGSRVVVFLNLLFLLSIILLPVTNALYGSYNLSSAVAVLYGLHLTVIATLNAGLWWLVHRESRNHPEFIGSVFPVMVFLPGTLVALFAPRYSQYLWFLAFGALFVGRFFRKSAGEFDSGPARRLEDRRGG